MTNAEKYKNEIRAQTKKTGYWTINKDTNEVMSCDDCGKCLFNCGNCAMRMCEWLVSEYKEPKEK